MATPNQDPFTTAQLRQALGMFATGVTIVTACTPRGEPVGVTVNSFNAVSLSPALVLWSLARKAGTLSAFQTSSHYAINVLSCEQQALAQRFAARVEDRFAGVSWHAGRGGAPLIGGAIAQFECRQRSQYTEGDHVIFVGLVERCQHLAEGTPLLFHGGRFFTELPLAV
ncbi:MAG: flavin reductase family protein [Rhodoferax sp.]